MRSRICSRGRKRSVPLIALACAYVLAPASVAVAQSLETGSVLHAVAQLKPGEYLWMPQAAPQGPMLLIVNRRTQRAILYRNAIPIAVTTVSTGRKDHRTPLGAFTILQKREVHFSSIYDAAPMPFMQRLTWNGVALHGGHLPGYPASHGCIRLPHDFAKLLFAETRLGMTVVVTDQPLAPTLAVASEFRLEVGADNDFTWMPQVAPTGPISIVISGAEQRAVVLRNGQLIGMAKLRIQGAIKRPQLFAVTSTSSEGLGWSSIPLPGQQDLTPLDASIVAPPGFRAVVEPLLGPGTTVIITPDALRLGQPDAVLLEGGKRPAGK